MKYISAPAIEPTLTRNNQFEYNIWLGIKQRCTNPNQAVYKYYGARGIKVCDKWFNDYEAFIKDIGYRPSSKHTIDRIDNNGNYEPGNVRWTDWVTQANNRRPKVFNKFCSCNQLRLI